MDDSEDCVKAEAVRKLFLVLDRWYFYDVFS